MAKSVIDDSQETSASVNTTYPSSHASALQPSDSALPATPTLTKTLMGLQWKLLLRSYRKNWGKIIGTGFTALYGAGFLVFATVFLGSMLFLPAETESFALVIRVYGTVLVLGWTVLTLFSFGMDDTLSPTKFAQFGRGPRELLKPVFFASLLSVGFFLTAIFVIVMVALQAIWLVGSLLSGSGAALHAVNAVAALIALIPMSLAGLALCVLIPRAIWAWRATLRLSKRKMEMLQAGGLVVFLVVAYSFNLVTNAGSGLMDLLFHAAQTLFEALVWTPFGAPFSVPIDIAQGMWLAAFIRLVLTAASLWLLWRWWAMSFAEGQLQALKSARTDKALKEKPLVPSFMKANPLGAATGRALRYWRRDPRYSMAILMMPILGIFFLAMSVTMSDSSFMAYVAVAGTAWMGGISLSNEIGFDGPSSWVNITAGINNRANLAGRYLALAILILPWTVLIAVVAPLLHSQPEMIAVTVPSAIGFLASSWGVSMVVGALVPYPTPRPGSMKTSSTSMMWLSTFAAVIGTWVPMIPSIILIAVGLKAVPGLEYVGAGLAIVVGVVSFWLGLTWAAKHLDKTYPEAFQQVKHFTD